MDQVLETALRRRPKPLVATTKIEGGKDGGREAGKDAETPLPRPSFPSDQPAVRV
jgi:hypothetical protein